VLEVNPSTKTKWANQDACHAALRAAGSTWDFGGSGVTAADINWLVLGLIDPAVRRPSWMHVSMISDVGISLITLVVISHV